MALAGYKQSLRMTGGVMTVRFRAQKLVNSSGCQRNSAKLPGGRKKGVTLGALAFLPHSLSDKLLQNTFERQTAGLAGDWPRLRSFVLWTGSRIDRSRLGDEESKLSLQDPFIPKPSH